MKHFGYLGPWCQTVWSKPPIFTVFFLLSYKLRLHLHSLRCCQNTCKMHVVWISSSHLHKCFNIYFDLVLSYQSTFDGSVKCFLQNLGIFFCFSGLHECLLHAYCWVTTSCSSPRHFAWHATNCSCSASCYNVTFQSCVYITPISLCKCFLSMFRNVGPSCGGQYANILCQSPLTVYCVKWQIKCQMNHIIQLCCIHKIVSAQWWLKRTSFLKAFNNLVTDHEIQILSTRSIQCCCFRNN